MNVPQSIHQQFAPNLSLEVFVEKILAFLVEKFGLQGLDSKVNMEIVVKDYGTEIANLFH